MTSAVASPTAKETLTAKLDQHAGKVNYLDFWASWCVPCRKSFPWMSEMQTKYQNQDFTVISINVDADKTLADTFLINNPINFPVVFDPNGELAKEFKLKGMPSSFIIDKSRNIVKAHTGFFTDKMPEYEKELSSLIFENTTNVSDK
jgi:thiol-disulfide isomerase/thioredoxin